MQKKKRNYKAFCQIYLYLVIPTLLAVCNLIVVILLLIKGGVSNTVWDMMTIFQSIIIAWVLLAFYIEECQKKLCFMNMDRISKIYIHGFDSEYLMYTNFFNRLGCYVGHGLCYEAGAVEMLAWRNNRTARYVYGRAYIDSLHAWYEHCWIELKAFGMWWVIDPTWINPTFPELRVCYRLTNLAKVTKVYSYEDFWDLNVVCEMQERLSNPETSFLFGELSFFRPDENMEMLFKGAGVMNLPDEGRGFSVTSLGMYSIMRPVTHRIIFQFASRPSRTLPKRKAFRRGRVLAKEIHGMMEYAAEEFKIENKNEIKCSIASICADKSA